MSEHIRNRLIRTAIVGGFALALASCDDPASPPPGAGDPENISRVTITLTPTGTTGTAQTSSRFDPDGSQLPQPVGAASASLALNKGATYNGTIVLRNDIDPNNVIDITAEVAAEEDFHQFVYTFELTGGGACAGVSVPAASMDVDGNGQPVGLTYQVVVTAAAASTTSCNMRVLLRHFDGIPKSSPNFDTDLDITFPVVIP